MRRRWRGRGDEEMRWKYFMNSINNRNNRK